MRGNSREGEARQCAWRLAPNKFNRAVVIAMIAVRMVQMPIDEIADVVAVRDGFVATARTVNVTRFMTRAGVVRRAAIRVLLADLDHMLVHMVPVRVVKMPIMQVIDMVAVTDSGVPAIRAVDMVVVLVMGKITFGHSIAPACQCRSQACATAFLTRLSTWTSSMA